MSVPSAPYNEAKQGYKFQFVVYNGASLKSWILSGKKYQTTTDNGVLQLYIYDGEDNLTAHFGGTITFKIQPIEDKKTNRK